MRLAFDFMAPSLRGGLACHAARSRALDLTWEQSTQLFLAHLVPVRKPIPVEPWAR